MCNKRYGKSRGCGALAALVLVLCGYGVQAQPQPDPVAPAAQEAGGPAPALDRTAVDRFYRDSVAAQLAGAEETVSFLKKHAAEDLSASMKLISRVPGAPQPQTEEMTLGKRQLILKTKEGARNTRVQSFRTNLLSVKFSEDKKRALVKNTSFAVSLVRLMSPEGGSVLMRAEQSMFCDDELKISPGGLIQFDKSRCSVEVVLEPKS